MSLDVGTTIVGIKMGGFTEVNPIMRPLTTRPALLILTTGGITALIGVCLRDFARTHPKLALTFALIYGGMHLTMGVHNWRVIRSR